MLKKFNSKYRYTLILLREMVRADYKVKYQDSALGYFWSVLRPLFLFVILYAVFAVGLRVGKGIENWPVALLAGIVIWQFFTDVTKSGLKIIVSNGSLLRKLKFPRYTVVLAGVMSALISMGINIILVIGFALVSGVPLLPTLPLLVFVLFEVFIFSLGLAFFLGALYVKFRDIQYIWDILLRGGFYASAIIYPISLIANGGENGALVAKILLIVNPVAQAIQDVRNFAVNPEIDSLWTLGGNNIWLYGIPVSISILTFVLGAWYFKRQSPYFAENI
jgi:ABC-2 type transport system permease protein